MFNNNTKNRIKLIPVTALILSIIFTGKSLADESLYANQLPELSDRDLVLIGTDKSGNRVTARSTTPVVVIIDRKELYFLNL